MGASVRAYACCVTAMPVIVMLSISAPTSFRDGAAWSGSTS
ncbi:hypothetical protein [Cellulomonas telluris]|nr:hypothetical protein [Cellulomonas telluris]